MLRSLHLHPTAQCLRRGLKPLKLRASTFAVKRDFHASVRRHFTPIDVLEVCHSYLPYHAAIPVLAAAPHVIRYFLVDRRAAFREFQAQQRLGPIERTWFVDCRRRAHLASNPVGKKGSRTAAGVSGEEDEAAQGPPSHYLMKLYEVDENAMGTLYNRAQKLEDDYGVSPLKRLLPLFTTAVLHCTWTLAVCLQMAGSSLTQNIALEAFQSFALSRNAAAAVPSISDIEHAIDAHYLPSVDVNLIAISGLILGLLYLRRCTALTSMKVGDLHNFPLLARIIDPFNKQPVFVVEQLDTDDPVQIPRWLQFYRSAFDYTPSMIRLCWHDSRFLPQAVISTTITLIVLGFGLDVFVTLFTPAQVLFLSNCGAAAWLRSRALGTYQMSLNTKLKEKSRRWLPLAPRGKT